MRYWILLLMCVQTAMATASEKKTIYGYVEKVWVEALQQCLPAKLDTGALSASLYAIDIEPFEKNGEDWLQFKVPTPKGPVTVKTPLIGSVNIKKRKEEKKGPKSRASERPLVQLTLILGNKQQELQVNLTNRKGFIYPLLLGRDAIKSFQGIIDPSQKYTVLPKKDCS